jgi:lipopolysaccharide/colanic/teichoic acid biosynthesis glycosyltransferase
MQLTMVHQSGSSKLCRQLIGDLLDWDITRRLVMQGLTEVTDVFNAGNNRVLFERSLIEPFSASWVGGNFSIKEIDKINDSSCLLVSNGLMPGIVNRDILEKLMVGKRDGVVAIYARRSITAYREKVLFNTRGDVAGFRRFYEDSVEPTFCGDHWPHHLFIGGCIAADLFGDGNFPDSFITFKELCRDHDIKISAYAVAGDYYDLNNADECLRFILRQVSRQSNYRYWRLGDLSHIHGDVLISKEAEVDSKAMILGPAIVLRGAKVMGGACVSSAVIGPDSVVKSGSFVSNCLFGNKYNSFSATKVLCGFTSNLLVQRSDNFHYWPLFSYARLWKRILDVVGSLGAIVLFVPLIPVIAFAIKMNSKGPVFFKTKRQGRWGRAFSCIKFRSMIHGADKLQDDLKIMNQIDGPQFKMEDDPRVSVLGRFLRETYLDELPQFFNVLLGHMSIVGPRPSPRCENTLCPYWRDMRLSVRPGITGLWQIHRTRRSGHDFQEWIYYDTEYINNISLRQDMKIFFQTGVKMAKKFIERF